jgi:maltooligosyltrehalose trehalohydrolase
MPFGAQVLADGQVRFRLWAPAARRVELCLPEEAPELMLPMEAEASGWFNLVTSQARCSSRYQFRIDGGHRVPDPASRCQPDDVHGPSRVVDPQAWEWSDGHWCGRPWEEAVFYELHVGSFTPEGTFRAAAQKLDHLVDLGVTALQLMPLAEFPGRRDWGYDGVLPFAPESGYGTPEDLKYLVQTAHTKGLMVFLDVVYNHFGPEGNYLHLYAPAFFTGRHRTPWGDAVAFDDAGSHWVRQYFIHNALYWLEEFHLDGLRLDAVHAIFDDSSPCILEELAAVVRERIGAVRSVHLVLENDQNAAHHLERDARGQVLRYAAQWNDDLHHVLHVLLTGETVGYYGDYADRPIHHLGRCLCEGFAYQGEPSAYRGGRNRGEPSRHLPPTAFVGFLQNHDQIGNRAFGERITDLASEAALRAATAVLLLAPSPPLLFMGQEWGSRRRFAFFCDFAPDLAAKVTEGRRLEFARFPEFSDPQSRARIPDPAAQATFDNAVLDWETADTPEGSRWLAFHRDLLALRAREIVPRLTGIQGDSAQFHTLSERALLARWRLGDGSSLQLLANLGPNPVRLADWPRGRIIRAVPEALDAAPQDLPAWAAVWLVQEAQSHVR